MKIILVYIDNHKKITGYLFVDEWLICKATDLSLGLASIKAYSRLDPFIEKSCKFVNRVYVDHLTSDLIAQDILSEDPDLVGFSINLWNFEKTKSIGRIIKGKNPKIKIVLGGPMVPDDIELNKQMLFSNPEIDALIRGEGELPFRQLLRYYLRKGNGSKISNTALRNRNHLFVSKERISLKNLSELPSPYLSGEVTIYDNTAGLVALETSRGCIFDCAYCRYHGGEKPRFFNIEKVRQEFKLLKNKNFKGNVFITDPLFNVNKERAKDILKIMEGIDYKICLDIRLEFIDDEMIELFKNIPGLELSVGIQSINPVALRNINRPTNIPRCRETLLKLAQEGINVGVDLIMGLPGDNYQKFKKTIDWVVYCRAEQVDVNDLIIIPNSPLEKLTGNFKIKYNRENMALSNYSFSNKDMIKASHFKIAFQFLFGYHQKVFNILVYDYKLKPSDIIEKFVYVAKERGEIPNGRLFDLSNIRFSDQTFFYFLKYLFGYSEIVRYFLKPFKESSISLRDNENYKVEFGELQSNKSRERL